MANKRDQTSRSYSHSQSQSHSHSSQSRYASRRRSRSPNRGRSSQRDRSPHLDQSPQRNQRRNEYRQRSPLPRDNNRRDNRHRDDDYRDSGHQTLSRHHYHLRDESPRRNNRPQNQPQNAQSNMVVPSKDKQARERSDAADKKFLPAAYCLKCRKPSHWHSTCTWQGPPVIPPPKDFQLANCAWSQAKYKNNKNQEAWTIEVLIQHVYQASRRLHSYHNFANLRNAVLLQVVKQSINDPEVDPHRGKDNRLFPAAHTATVYEVFVAKTTKIAHTFFNECYEHLTKLYDDEIAQKLGFEATDPFDRNRVIKPLEKFSQVRDMIMERQNLIVKEEQSQEPESKQPDAVEWPEFDPNAYQRYIEGIQAALDKYSKANSNIQAEWTQTTKDLKIWKKPLEKGQQVFEKLPFEHFALKIESTAEFTIPTVWYPKVEILDHYVQQEAEAQKLAVVPVDREIQDVQTDLNKQLTGLQDQLQKQIHAVLQQHTQSTQDLLEQLQVQGQATASLAQSLEFLARALGMTIVPNPRNNGSILLPGMAHAHPQQPQQIATSGVLQSQSRGQGLPHHNRTGENKEGPNASIFPLPTREEGEDAWLNEMDTNPSYEPSDELM